MKIFKIGGSIIENERLLHQFISLLKKVEGSKILIHGGGKIASELSKKLNVDVKMNQGRRITDAASLKIVVMTYAGWINKNIVAKLNALDMQALGLSGADANLIQAYKRPVQNGIDYGFVGDISFINSNLISTLLDNDILPVIAPITADKNGQLLNINADTIATSIATSCAEKNRAELYFIFDQPGLMKDIHDSNSLINNIKIEEIDALKKEKIITDGMIPKVDNAISAIQKGVSKVVFTNLDGLSNILSGQNAGTQITL